MNKFENMFEEKRKEVDISNIDIDSQSYQRKKLELDERYEFKKETEESFCLREFELASNIDDEISKRMKLAAIKNDHDARMARLFSEYHKELEEIKSKYEAKYEKPLYFKWMYIGPINKYNRVMCGMQYYIKLKEFDKIDVYYDAKYSKIVTDNIPYVEEEWKEIHSEIF